MVDKNLPKGEGWHTKLLLQMAKPIEGIREAVIAGDLLQNLKEYLRFRHLFIHVYGFELDWNRFKNLCVELENILNELKTEIDAFEEFREK